ncbi:diaminopimelate epimerase [Halapricum desulfuricans]|uniref:Diaminopimelate epimerase n=1 Tax=Halapricum desulfuricans TaxID=2841257 RepID=A0A897NIR6_9EURY|nr:diaminopimelate epimerase [Halapricum desulfuricans]QSG10196.1 Diaminopimelate epimerase/Proline racemase [Halapricum desulfuricans]
MITVEKYHGTGNDFVVVEADAPIEDRASFTRRLADRETGLDHPDGERVGADGVLFLKLDASTAPTRVEMTLVQPDGSVAEMCGNGARVVATWAAGRTGDREFVIDTPAGEYPAEVGQEGVAVEMGEPTFDPDAVPTTLDEPLIERETEGLTVTAVNTGVPHAVAFVEDVAEIDLEAIAPPVRHAAVFPEGANVTVASERTDGSVFGYDQRTFERGVEGETRSCGTGAVAIVAAAHELGRVETDQSVPVHPPGGRLVVTRTADGAILQGPVEREFETTVPADGAVAER